MRILKSTNLMIVGMVIMLLILSFNLLYAVVSPENLVYNSDFEEGTEGWNLTASGAEVVSEDIHGGNAALLLDTTYSTSEINIISRPVGVKPSVPYKLGAFIKQLEGEGIYKVVIDWQNASGKHISYSNDWKGANRPEIYRFHGGIFVSPKNAASARIYLGVQAGTKCLFDDVSLKLLDDKPITGERVDGDGTAQIIIPEGDVAASSFQTFRIKYTAGKSGLPPGGGIQLRKSTVNTQWSPVQVDEPTEAGYVTARASTGSDLLVTVENPGKVPEIINVQVEFPGLEEGDSIEVVYGDKNAGSPGVKVQQETEADIEFVVASDSDRDGEFADIDESPTFNVVPGEASKLRVVAPSTAEVGLPSQVTVEATDESGNVSPGYTGTVNLSSSDAEAEFEGKYTYSPADRGIHTFEVSFAAPGEHKLIADADDLEAGESSIFVSVPRPSLEDEAPEVARVYPVSSSVVLENENIRAVFVKNESGFGYVPVFVRKASSWKQVAACRSLGELRYNLSSGERAGTKITTSSYKILKTSGKEAAVKFSGSFEDADGAKWGVEVTYSLQKGARHIESEHAVSVDQNRNLLAFYGPVVYAGDNSFGREKYQGLFPALEYLTSEEVSSSMKVVAAGQNERYVPHPYKITVPLMAVVSDAAEASERTAVMLMWDPVQKWDGKNASPAAKFACPNRLEHKANHLMSLFVPTVPKWVTENESEASTPYEIEAGKKLKLKAQIAAIHPVGDVIEAVKYWFAANGMPDLPPKPRSHEDEILHSIKTYLRVWDESAKRWHITNTSGPIYDAMIALHLTKYSMITDDEKLKEQINYQLSQAIKKASGNWPGLDLAFHLGHVPQATEGAKRNARRFIKNQLPDGSWVYRPRESGNFTYAQSYSIGKSGDTALGICSEPTWNLLKMARMTGDRKCLKAGLIGLAYMERFNRPAGGETWEVPLHAPNLRAPALAVHSLCDAYLISGDEKYLERAKYWAYTGLPFIYFWTAADRPAMRGASISVMGTTLYTHTWFGRAVQWVGLVYARALAQLSELDDSFPWGHVVEMITIGGVNQEKDENAPCGEGHYPDSYSLIKGEETYYWDFTPRGILENLYYIVGQDPTVKTVILDTEPEIHLNSAAAIESAGMDGETLKAKLAYHADQTCYTLICNVSEPEEVYFGGEALKVAEDIGQEKFGVTSKPGWKYISERGYLIIRTAFSSPSAELVIKGIQSKQAK